MSVQTRIRCDHDQCARTLPLDGKHDRSSLRYQAASEQWDVSDEGDFCPRHKPGAEVVREWAVQHPQIHTTVHRTAYAALYTLSKLPGGVLVTRMSNVTEWTRETRCVCGPQLKPGHYQGCPAIHEGVSA